MAFSRFERFENMDPRVKVQKEGAGPPLFLHFPVFCKFFFGIYDDMVIMELVYYKTIQQDTGYKVFLHIPAQSTPLNHTS
jgi:hypothetical protein